MQIEYFLHQWGWWVGPPLGVSVEPATAGMDNQGKLSETKWKLSETKFKGICFMFSVAIIASPFTFKGDVKVFRLVKEGGWEED